MATRACLCSAFALAVVLFCSNTAADINVNNLCLLLGNNAYIANGTSCTDYYLCSNGVATSQSCSSGTYFDKNAQTCVKKRPSYCVNSNTEPCAGLSTGSYAAVPGSCSGFYYCSANGAQQSNCPTDLNFNPTKQSCDYKSNYMCQTSTSANNTVAINLCSYIQNDIFFGDAFNCAGWQKCKNNSIYTIGSCSNGLVFDTTTAICNYPEYVQCSQVTNDPNLNTNSPAGDGACTQNGAFKNTTTCNQYYVCNSGYWELRECPRSYYFDTVSNQCLDRLNATNNCDRCLGTTKTFVNNFGTNCTGYLYCSNGIKKSSGSCASGLFFDEILGGCVVNNPNFTFCTSSSTTTASPSTTVNPATELTTVIPATETTTVNSTAETTIQESAT